MGDIQPRKNAKEDLYKLKEEAKMTRSQWRLRHLHPKTVNCIRENQNHKTSWLRGHVTLRMRASCSTSTPWQVWCQ